MVLEEKSRQRGGNSSGGQEANFGGIGDLGDLATVTQPVSVCCVCLCAFCLCLSACVTAGHCRTCYSSCRVWVMTGLQAGHVVGK